MARLSRLVLAGQPHHVTQRGNRRGQTFFEEGDYELYRDLLAEAARKAGSLDTIVSCKQHMPARWAAVPHPKGRALFAGGNELPGSWYMYHIASHSVTAGKKRSGEMGQYLCCLV